jgi:antitoxin component of MazEF toxin-antitoxin module
MKLRVEQSGEGAAIQFPTESLSALEVAPGSEVDMAVEGRSVCLFSTPKRPALQEMVAEMQRLGGRDYDFGQYEWPPDEWPDPEEAGE